MVKNSLVRRVTSCGLGVTTSLVCSCPMNCAKAMNSSKSNNINPDELQRQVNERLNKDLKEVSPKSRTVITVLDALLFNVLSQWYAGHILRGVGILVLRGALVAGLIALGVPNLIALVAVNAAIGLFSSIRSALGLAKDSKGRLITQW